MSEIFILFADNDMVLEISKLRNDVTGAFLNAAMVTVRLLNEDGTPVTGSAWPLPLDYVSDSEGVYRAILADTLVLTNASRYIAEVIADAGGGLRAKWALDCICRTRQ